MRWETIILLTALGVAPAAAAESEDWSRDPLFKGEGWYEFVQWDEGFVEREGLDLSDGPYPSEDECNAALPEGYPRPPDYVFSYGEEDYFCERVEDKGHMAE